MDSKPTLEKRLEVFEQYLRFFRAHPCSRLICMSISNRNICVLSKDRLYVIDFNAITPIGTHTLLMASSAWSAPESKEQESKSEAFDVYGAGCLMEYLQLNTGSLKKIRNKALQTAQVRYENAHSLKDALESWKKKRKRLKRSAALLLLSAAIAAAFDFYKREANDLIPATGNGKRSTI